MKRSIRTILLASAVLFAAVACKKEGEVVEKDYLKVIPSTITENLDGQGDGIVLSIKSNVEWNIEVEYPQGVSPWIKFEQISGKGNAEVFGAILRGSISSGRECTLTISGNGQSESFETVLPIKQGKFVPVYFDIDLSGAAKYAAGLAAGEKADLPDYAYLKTVVASDATCGNIPEGFAILSDGTTYVGIKTATPLAFGDSIKMETTGSKIGLNASGNGLVIYPAEGTQISCSTPAIAPEFKPSKIDADGVARCENMLVTVSSCQPAREYVGMTWGLGEVPMELPTKTDPLFYVKVATTCPFAGDIIPLNSGKVTGYVINGNLCPRSASDIKLTKEYDQEAGTTYVIKPIVNIMKCSSSTANVAENVTIENSNSRLAFKDLEGYSVAGSYIEKFPTSTTSAVTVVSTVAKPYDNCFTTKNWNADNSYLIFCVPVNQVIYGDLEFNFSISSAVFASAGKWEVSWSKDGSSWNPMDYVYGIDQKNATVAKGTYLAKMSSAAYLINRQVGEFSIPKAEAISSGNLYFKVMPLDNKIASGKTVRTNVGFYVCSKEAPTDLDDIDYLAAQTFDHCCNLNSPVIGTSVGYLGRLTSGSPESPNKDGWSAVGSCIARRKCVSSTAATATPAYMSSPALSMLTTPTTIKVTFKCAPFIEYNLTPKFYTADEISPGVSVDGSGSVGEITFDKPYTKDVFSWHTGTVTITGADNTTVVKVGNVDGNANARFFLDDIIITR